ncbi:MAG: hypothetical protein AAGM22_25405 [Acidobacteriota bacterium]
MTQRHPRSFLKRLVGILSRPASILDVNAPPDHPQSVGLDIFIEQEEGEPDLLMFQLVIDGETLTAFDHGPIDLPELERSLTTDGTFSIWTCTCGDAGCAGRPKGVRVKHSDGIVRWYDRDTLHHYGFAVADLTAALHAASAAARQVLSQQRSLGIAPDQNASYLRSAP